MPLPAEIPLRTGRMKLPLGIVFWLEDGTSQAETVVFLHGSWQDSSQWLPLMRHLSPGYHCLAPDLLGFGESRREGKTPYSVATQVECLHSLLSALRVQRCRLVAHSLGAWVAGRYALTYPDQVQSLTVLAPEGVSDRDLQHRWRRDRWLVAPWSPLPLVLPWLGQAAWVKALRQRRQCLRQTPAACQMLFQRRPAALRGELLNQELGYLKPPTLVLESVTADPTARRLGQIWLHQVPSAQHRQLPAAESPLGVEVAPCAEALEPWLRSQPLKPAGTAMYAAVNHNGSVTPGQARPPAF
ncbi:alpha/beta fold hydrolase [Leptolyngbya sp. KIOST-1]|uniref:alpha/beta fold hydrolase n=1 Tax=Leptolyngbya sp. KIOST-1 TaxID=1229172 RepID=UPI0018CFC856|nr:alpha/beta hydrolase [Leptolyngbya sp. KIOST-1]